MNRQSSSFSFLLIAGVVLTIAVGVGCYLLVPHLLGSAVLVGGVSILIAGAIYLKSVNCCVECGRSIHLPARICQICVEEDNCI